MMGRRLLALATLLAVTGPAAAAAHCALSATGLAFPGYDSLRATPADTVGTIGVSCSGSGKDAASYALDLSTGSSNTYATRTMRKGAVTLRYNLYSDPARTAIWGDGGGICGEVVDGYAVSQFGSLHRYSVYGRIFARQNVAPGVYADAIVVTLRF